MNQTTQTLLPTPTWLRRYTKLVAASTLFLIFAGAMVTSTGSGLAVPDWPLAYGMVFPPMVGGIFYEHGHRLIAATVGFLTLLQAFFLWRFEPKGFLRKLGWASLGAVIAQGVLGGITVLFYLPPAVSIAHAGLAEVFFCLNLSIAFFASKAFLGLRAEARPHGGTAMATMLPVAAYLQILLGALMRHLGAGLAIPDFPLAFGRLVPPIDSVGVAANFAHRIGALTVAVLILVAGKAILSIPAGYVRKAWIALLGIVALQVTLGAFTVWSGKNPVITSLHVMTGAALLGTSLLVALSARASRSEAEERSAPLGREVTA